MQSAQLDESKIGAYRPQRTVSWCCSSPSGLRARRQRCSMTLMGSACRRAIGPRRRTSCSGPRCTRAARPEPPVLAAPLARITPRFTLRRRSPTCVSVNEHNPDRDDPRALTPDVPPRISNQPVRRTPPRDAPLCCPQIGTRRHLVRMAVRVYVNLEPHERAASRVPRSRTTDPSG